MLPNIRNEDKYIITDIQKFCRERGCDGIVLLEFDYNQTISINEFCNMRHVMWGILKSQNIDIILKNSVYGASTRMIVVSTDTNRKVTNKPVENEQVITLAKAMHSNSFLSKRLYETLLIYANSRLQRQ